MQQRSKYTVHLLVEKLQKAKRTKVVQDNKPDRHDMY